MNPQKRKNRNKMSQLSTYAGSRVERVTPLNTCAPLAVPKVLYLHIYSASSPYIVCTYYETPVCMSG